MDTTLREELLRRVERDQAVRAAVPVGEPLSAELRREWFDVDASNTEFLRSVIAAHGWPGIGLVGEDGAHGAWVLAQHADRDRDFQRTCLRLLREAVAAGQAAAKDLAYLEDRCRVAANKPQLYGTQYNATGPEPIHEPDLLDERRAQVGLGPHADYDKRMREQIFAVGEGTTYRTKRTGTPPRVAEAKNPR